MKGRPSRALSVRQPYAELILRGLKKAEYRSLRTNIRERVYIYASRKPGPEKAWARAGKDPGDLPTGLLVGTVEIIDCVPDGDGHAWKLKDPRRLRPALVPKKAPQPVWFRPF